MSLSFGPDASDRAGVKANHKPRTRPDMVRVCVLQTDACAVAKGNFDNDWKTEPGAVHFAAKGTVERLEDKFAFGQRDAGAGVFDLKQEHLAKRVDQHSRSVVRHIELQFTASSVAHSLTGQRVDAVWQ